MRLAQDRKSLKLRQRPANPVLFFLGRCYPEAPFDCDRVPDDLARQTVQFFRVLGIAFLAASRG
jgi:hypothetical protein